MTFQLFPRERMTDRMRTPRQCRLTLLRVLTATVLACGLSACRDRNSVRVHLQSHTPPGKDLVRLEIQAQVTGPQTGLRYKWFSVSGECEPQESGSPVTTFKFAESVNRDRVSVEVWRGDKRVAQDEINVTL